MHEVGKESVQYRGPVIWNFLNRIVNLSSSETTKKDRLNGVYVDFLKILMNFQLRPRIIEKKSDDFI